MKKISETIVFFGSGPVAAESLRLLKKNFAIEAVITKPAPPHHHGSVPVISLAKTLNLPILTASNKRELDDLFATNPIKSRLGILIDFGIIVSQKVIDYFPLGIINSHFSILPEWRGADPITFAILSGQSQTGVSLMLLVEKMDEGPLLAYDEHELPADITTPKLTQDLINLSYTLLIDAVPRYLETQITFPQSLTKRKVSYSHKLSKSDGIIDWTKSAVQLEREVRAFTDWPASRTILAGREVIITKVQADSQQYTGSSKAKVGYTRIPGEVFLTDKKELAVQTGDGILMIEQIKPAGKREMTARAFLAGNKI